MSKIFFLLDLYFAYVVDLLVFFIILFYYFYLLDSYYLLFSYLLLLFVIIIVLDKAIISFANIVFYLLLVEKRFIFIMSGQDYISQIWKQNYERFLEYWHSLLSVSLTIALFHICTIVVDKFKKLYESIGNIIRISKCFI